jgi:hypothetical protein
VGVLVGACALDGKAAAVASTSTRLEPFLESGGLRTCSRIVLFSCVVSITAVFCFSVQMESMHVPMRSVSLAFCWHGAAMLHLLY